MKGLGVLYKHTKIDQEKHIYDHHLSTHKRTQVYTF